MPTFKTYAIRRRHGWHTPGQLEQSAELSAHVGDVEMPEDVRWIRSYVLAEPDGSLGTVCIYQATSPDKVREHASRSGMPADEVVEIAETMVVRADPERTAA